MIPNFKFLKTKTMKMITKKLTLWVFAGLALCAASSIQSCKKSSGSSTPPPSGPTSSSDSVEPGALVLYWNFNNTPNESKLGLTGNPVGGSYVTGVRGQAWQGSSSSYITVPIGADSTKLTTAFPSYSVSVWYSLPKSQISISGGSAQGIFFMSPDNTGSNGNEFIIEADIASANQVATDSVPIHHGFDNLGGVAGSWQNFTLASYDTATTNWVNIVMTYDGASSIYTYFENGVAIGASSAFTNGKYVTPNTIYDGPLPLGSGSPATQLQGTLSFTGNAPTMFYIGCWPPGLYGVSTTLGLKGNFTGAIDELRVFNIALDQQDIAYLYQDGAAGK
jgi:hypothetical protein